MASSPSDMDLGWGFQAAFASGTRSSRERVVFISSSNSGSRASLMAMARSPKRDEWKAEKVTPADERGRVRLFPGQAPDPSQDTALPRLPLGGDEDGVVAGNGA